MLGKIVTVKIDRPIGSVHPEYNDMVYPVNYGYIEGIYADDLEEQDAYVLGVLEPVSEFTGRVIAVIKRENDVEDKLVVANDKFSKEEIYKLTHFTEKYFDSHIIMEESSYEDLIWDIKNAGIKSDEKLMIHSSLRSVGKISGGATTLVNAFINVMNDGLLIFPTHTWATIQKDEMVFDNDLSDSCVGALTNVARKMPGFKRSMHPTHSVCAYGKGRDEYLALDLDAKTPASPNGCFGALKNMNAKILFLGAPLSKNTFVHSIEEEMNVPDRFTSHIYHFISKDNDVIRDYYMPRHYSTKSAHISDHYEKLLPIMLKNNIAKKVYIGNSVSYLVDAKMCNEMVKEILSKDIHALDDFEKVDHLYESSK